jgi:hypothetical protein
MNYINVMPNEANWAEFCKAWHEQEHMTQRIIDADTQKRVESMKENLKDSPPFVAEAVMNTLQTFFMEDKRILKSHVDLLQRLSRYLFEATTKETSDTVYESVKQLITDNSRQKSSLLAASYAQVNQAPTTWTQPSLVSSYPGASATNNMPFQTSSTSLQTVAENTLTHIDEILRATPPNNPSPQSASLAQHGAAEQITPEHYQRYPASNTILSPSLTRPPVNTPVSPINVSNSDNQAPFLASSSYPFPRPSNSTSAPNTQPPTTMSQVPPIQRIIEFPARTKTRGPGKFYLMRCPVIGCQRYFDTVQGCFTHLNQSDQAHAEALGPEIKHKNFGTAVAIAGIEILDGEAAAMDEHNAKRMELLRVS